MANTLLNFPCVSFRRIPLFEQTSEKNAENAGSHIRRYIAIVDVSYIPLDFPKQTNPRDVKLTTNVARQIATSLRNEEYFHILNRGILLSAKHVKHDDKTGELLIDFGGPDDEDIYGVVDGGHTYQIIQDYIKKREHEYNGKRAVSLEIFTGIGASEQSISITDFAAARNNSVPVDQKSLAELDNKFDFIKEAIKEQPYADNIGYRQNSTEDIDIREIIALMTVFNVEKYTPLDLDNQPVKAYSQREDCLNDYLHQLKNEKESNIVSGYRKLRNILPKILELADHIRYDVPRVWNKQLGGKIGTKLNKIKKGERQYFFLPTLNNLNTEDEENFDTRGKYWLWLPILAAMRVLVDYDQNGVAFFKNDPIEFYNSHARTFVSILYQNCKNNFVPNRIGKDKSMWTSLVQAAWMQAVQTGVLKISI